MKKFFKVTKKILLPAAVLALLLYPASSTPASDPFEHLDSLMQYGPYLPSVTPTATPLPAGPYLPTDAPLASETPEPSSASAGTLSPSSGSSLLSQDNSQEQERLDQISNQMKAQLPSSNGMWSFYLCDLDHDTNSSFQNASMQSASLIKLFIMGAVYENYDSLTSVYGKNSIDSLLFSMITVSDNDASNTLTRYLGNGDDTTGRNVVNAFCLSHGYGSTSMGRMLLAPATNGDNLTSVEDCGQFLKEVYETHMGTSSALPHGEDMYQLLSQQTRRNKIPAQMPSGVTVANKTGELDTVENDAAIVCDDSGDKHFILVFLSQKLSDAWSAQNTIASLSRFVYDSI